MTLSTLGRTDIRILALRFDLECKRNSHGWRAAKYSRLSKNKDHTTIIKVIRITRSNTPTGGGDDTEVNNTPETSHGHDEGSQEEFAGQLPLQATDGAQSQASSTNRWSQKPHLGQNQAHPHENGQSIEFNRVLRARDVEQSACMPTLPDTSQRILDPDGWITPSYIKKHQPKEAINSISTEA